MGRKSNFFAKVDLTSWIPVFYCFMHLCFAVYTEGVDRFLDNCLSNPLLGGPAGIQAREKDLPLYSYEVGHIVPGLLVSWIGAGVLYVFAKEYLYAPRDDARSAFVSGLAVIGSAPLVAPLHKLVCEARIGRVYFDIGDHPLYYIPLALIGSMIITETWFYWWHYLGHKNKFVWKYIHSLHHTFVPSTSMCASAFHPFDLAGLTIGSFVASTILPIYFPAQNGLLLTNFVWGIYQHSAWRSRLPPIARSIFNDSMSHTIHHDMGQVPRNLGSLCCIWDKLIGTYQENPPKWAVLKA